ncbi:MAG: hypothetical protein R3B54_06760 [Bdellovibrionota bacterium]
MRLIGSHFLRSRTGLESPGIEAIQLTLAPALFGACSLLYSGVPNPFLPPLLAAAVVTFAWVIGAIQFRRSPFWGLALLSVCTACFCALVVWHFRQQPTLAFVLLGLSIFHLGWVWQETQCSGVIKHWRTTLNASVRDSSLTCLVLWFVLGILRLLDQSLWFRLLMSANAIVIAFTLALLFLDRRSQKKGPTVKGVAIALAALVGFETYSATIWALARVLCPTLCFLGAPSNQGTNRTWSVGEHSRTPPTCHRPVLCLLVLFGGFVFIDARGLRG